jgi:hypothetical protein
MLDTTESMLVHELFPELAKQILHDLRGLKRNDLAAQVMKLRVVDRCRCGSGACGTFYTQEAESRKWIPEYGVDIMLNCGAKVAEIEGTIVEIETLDPQVNEALCRVIP